MKTPTRMNSLKKLALGLLLLATGTAAYAADTDADGLPDAWEIEHFGHVIVSNGTGDFDRDGRTDAQELADNTNPTDRGSTLGLVVYYPLDGNANDATTNTYDATASNLSYVGNRYGESGKAAGLNGSSSSVKMNDNILNLGQSAYSISLWFNTANKSQSTQCLFNTIPHAGLSFVYNFSAKPSCLSVFIGNGTTWHLGAQNGAKTDYVNNEWYHVVFVKNGSLYSFSVNGVVDFQTTHSGASAYDLNVPLLFGEISYNAEYLNGSLDDIRIYNRAISSDEITRLYTATSQPTTHLITLHPGDHGDIPGANSGTDYVTNVTHDTIFTPPTPVADPGYTFTGWNPSIPATITTNFSVTAVYAPVMHTLTVLSAHGAADPATGTNSFTWGTSLTGSVTSPDLQGMTQFVCAGWTGTGNVPISGTGTNTGSFTLTQDSAITWLWNTEYAVNTEVSGSGTVDLADGFYAAGSTQNLKATPDTGWLFMGWSGDLTGGYTSSNTTLVINAPKSVTATFSDDADGDGLLNTNEWAIGTHPRNRDSDGDGVDDGFEVSQGLSPTSHNQALFDYILSNKTSFGYYTADELGTLALGDLQISVKNGTANLRLQLRKSLDLTTWTNAGEAVEWHMPTDAGKAFYKVQGGE